MSILINEDNCIYHIMGASLDEILLYRDDEDKEKYLFYIQKYQRILGFKLYAYCLMPKCVHMIIDTNRTDISKVMKGINQSYTKYYNIRHRHYGYVFGERYKREIVDDENYLLTLTGYIHSNPREIKEWETCPEKYSYSSLGVYLGLNRDENGIINEEFMNNLLGENINRAREDYLKFVMNCYDEKMKRYYNFKCRRSKHNRENMQMAAGMPKVTC